MSVNLVDMAQEYQSDRPRAPRPEGPLRAVLVRASLARVLETSLGVLDGLVAEGFEVAVHAHANEQFVVCLEGETEFTLEEPGGTRTVTVTGGQVLELPPNVPHGARAIRRTVILDCFSPPSEKTGVDA